MQLSSGSRRASLPQAHLHLYLLQGAHKRLGIMAVDEAVIHAVGQLPDCWMHVATPNCPVTAGRA